MENLCLNKNVEFPNVDLKSASEKNMWCHFLDAESNVQNPPLYSCNPRLKSVRKVQIFYTDSALIPGQENLTKGEYARFTCLSPYSQVYIATQHFTCMVYHCLMLVIHLFLGHWGHVVFLYIFFYILYDSVYGGSWDLFFTVVLPFFIPF